ncbi:MAG: PQQ-binding-like beta-propeller repeat protein, partial [Alphaproteobacteria bacterium]|nr:PQQ-binding-like beta-propeller repeat protein [Alphaproteobacteria bacterium]
MHKRAIFAAFIGWLFLTASAIAAHDPFSPAHEAAKDKPQAEWAHYGGGLDGARFSRGDAITADTIAGLSQAWRFQTGDATDGEGYFGRRSSFKATPILFDGKLVVSTGFNRVFALDPVTGEELWRYDPGVDFSIEYSEMFTSRGVAAWSDEGHGHDGDCAQRIFLGTLDARLIALDARSGAKCAGFGRDGEVDLSKGVKNYRRSQYSLTSPPTVVNGVVVVGSSVGDNGAVKLDHGIVRGYDARTGALKWSWDPIPRTKNAALAQSWKGGSAKKTGAANVWSVMAADPERNLVFLPTTSPSPDFYGGERLGDNRNANSVVALNATTGRLVWAYQIVRHDLWDYDLASQPLLMDIPIDGERRAALVLATKMGFVFVLDRETGAPLFPVSEQAVPQSDVPGEEAAARQKFPSIQLHPTKAALDIWPYSPGHVATCRKLLDGVRYDGIFTPPSLEGTLVYPGNPGGVNWGSMAAHLDAQIAVVAVNRLPTVVRLIARKDFRAAKTGPQPASASVQYTEQSGTPYGMARYELINEETGRHCLKGPWSTLVGLDMKTGDVIWEVAAGNAPGIKPQSEAADWGFYARGGPMITSGGYAFLATPYDLTLRAYELKTGAVAWSA